jgi:hypothetical protein
LYDHREVEHNSTVLQVVACKNPNRGRLVVMNPGAESEEIELHFPEGGRANILDAYVTSEANDLRAVSRRMKDHKYRFPAESVTTLVIEGLGGKKKTGYF